MLLCLALGSGMAFVPAVAQPVSDTHVKAALVYNFMVFTEWPQVESQSSPFSVCISPKSKLYEVANVLQQKLVHGRKIMIRAFKESSDVPACDVLYLDSTLRSQWLAIRKAAAENNVLTIADPEVTSAEGAVITLLSVNDKIAFEVDSLGAKQASLSISSKMLRLARKVY